MKRRLKVLLSILGLSTIAMASVGCSAGDLIKQGVDQLFCEHEYSEFVETKAPTCYEKGEQERTCKKCEKVETKKIAMLDHNFKDGELFGMKDPTCTEVGYTAGVKCANKNCVAVIEPQEIPAFGHTEYNIPEQKASCFVNGHTAGVGCLYCDEILSGSEIIPAIGEHTWEVVRQVNPTCVTDGHTDYYHCTVCNESYGGEIISSLGHSYDEDNVCTVCGNITGQLSVINSSGDYNTVLYKNADGTYSYQFASVGDYICNESVVLDEGDTLSCNFKLKATSLAPIGTFSFGFGNLGVLTSTLSPDNCKYQIEFGFDATYALYYSHSNGGWELDNDYSINLRDVIIADGLERDYCITVTYAGDDMYDFTLSRLDDTDNVVLFEDSIMLRSEHAPLSLYLSTNHSTENYNGEGNTFSLTNIVYTKTLKD